MNAMRFDMQVLAVLYVVAMLTAHVAIGPVAPAEDIKVGLLHGGGPGGWLLGS